MSKILDSYFEALERLKRGNPKIVKQGSKINPDTVALEAGRKRGAIKRSRDTFLPIIDAIDNVNNEENTYKAKYYKLEKKKKEEIEKIKNLYEDSLNRELMLIDRLNTIEKLLESKKFYFPKSRK